MATGSLLGFLLVALTLTAVVWSIVDAIRNKAV